MSNNKESKEGTHAYVEVQVAHKCILIRDFTILIFHGVASIVFEMTCKETLKQLLELSWIAFASSRRTGHGQCLSVTSATTLQIIFLTCGGFHSLCFWVAILLSWWRESWSRVISYKGMLLSVALCWRNLIVLSKVSFSRSALNSSVVILRLVEAILASTCSNVACKSQFTDYTPCSSFLK